METIKLTSISYRRIGLMPEPERLEVGKKKRKLIIGVPKERQKLESRVSLTPQAVKTLTNSGHKILIERKAGENSNFSDLDYSNAGAVIVDTPDEVFRCEIVLKVVSPTVAEIQKMGKNQILISSFHLPTQTEATVRLMMEKRITAIAYEFLSDAENNRPIVRAMSEIAGSHSIMIAAEYLSNAHNGKGILLGGFTGITPTEVIIIGAGTASEYAARTAIGLGALVKIFDRSIYNLRRLENNIGQRLFTSLIHSQVLAKSLQSADVVIGALPINEFDDVMRYIVSEELISKMKPGSVIIDLSMDQGGCFETSEYTTHDNPVFKKYGIIHYCVPNIASRVSRTATIALSDILSTILLNISEAGGINEILRTDEGLRKGIYIYKGILTNAFIGGYFGIHSSDLDLLIPTFKQ